MKNTPFTGEGRGGFLSQGETVKKIWKQSDKIILAVSFLLLLFFTFYRLDADRVLGFDEGRHGVNALEMYRSGERIVSTYNGEPDYYNLKPPLSLYQIILGYRIFGVNKTGLRFFSAVAYVLTAVLAACFVGKRSDYLSAALCLFLFGSSKGLLLESCARKGDANAVYNLFFLVSMLALFQFAEYKKQEITDRKALFCCFGIGAGFSMAFLSKSYHAVLIPVIVFSTFLLERLFRKIRFREWTVLTVSGIMPVLIWALLRYSRDGTEFLRRMLLTDVFRRTTEQIAGTKSNPLYYVRMLVCDPGILLPLFLTAFAFLFTLYYGQKPGWDRKGLCVMILVPVFLYSIPKTRIPTYVYPSVIGLFISGSLAFYSVRMQKTEGAVRILRALGYGLTVCVLAFNMHGVFKAEQREHPCELETLVEESRELLTGTENIYCNFENPQYQTWFQDALFYIEKDTALHCRDGGIEKFREEEGEAYLLFSDYEPEAADFKIAAGEQLIAAGEHYRIIRKTGRAPAPD